MATTATPRLEPGRNIAMKIPSHEYAATVAFYRDVLGLRAIGIDGPSPVFEFGDKRLWLDEAPGASQAEIWLEIWTDDTAAAARFLDEHGVTRCDGIEPLPDGLDGFWISSPANIIHLVCND